MKILNNKTNLNNDTLFNAISQIDAIPDILIVVSGFEDRVLKIIELTKNLDLSNTIIINFRYKETDNEAGEANYEKYLRIKDHFENAKTKEYSETEIDLLEPSRTFESVSNFLFRRQKVGAKHHVIFDMSGCFDGIIPPLVKYLFEAEWVNRFELLYTKPESYNVTKTEPGLKDESYLQMTRSFVKVEPFDGFEGISHPLKNEKLILIPGFEAHKTEKMCSKFEESQKLMYLPKIEESEYAKHTHTVHSQLTIDFDIETREISLFNIPEIIAHLRDGMQDKHLRNYILGCFGNKLQLVASTLVSIEDPSILLMRVVLSNYNPKFFSTGMGSTVIVKIKKGDN